MNGIINIYKEKGFTSFDVVAIMRGILKMKKIGHTGTLDPDAEGVLPVCLGKGTKLVDMLTDRDKTYEAVLKLGVVTDTQDLTGTVLETRDVTMDYEQIESVILSYIGEYDQLPPMYSAIKVNGVKLYELAREGVEVERKTRRVEIKGIRILDYSKEEHEVRLSVDCSKGTYIRTLLHDIGATLGCGGAMKSLLRTRVGEFGIEDAVSLNRLKEIIQEGRITDYVLPVDYGFQKYHKLVVEDNLNIVVYNGNPLPKEMIFTHVSNLAIDFKSKEVLSSLKELSGDETEQLMIEALGGYNMVRVYDSNDIFIGVYHYNKIKDSLRPFKMFYEK